jgi:hypothetical protein
MPPPDTSKMALLFDSEDQQPPCFNQNLLAVQGFFGIYLKILIDWFRLYT